MTEKLYYADAYLTKFTGKVLECIENKKGYRVVLDRTCFYPEGGGQPADIGILGGGNVTDVHDKDGVIYHTMDRPLEIGSVVEGEINWEHRFDLMQNHSGEHILSGIICAKYGCDNVGFHMGKDIITIDLNTKIPEEDIAWLEEKANEAIWSNTPVSISYPSKDELKKIDYRSKKELEGDVRIVNVGEYDCCACCGTHVKLAGEIGQIKIIGIQSYKGGTRMELLCGKRALRDYRVKNDASAAVGSLLSVPSTKIETAVSNVIAEKNELTQKTDKLKWKFFTIKAEQIDSENAAFFGNELSGKDMTHFADIIIKKGLKRAAVFSAAADGFAFVLLSTEKDAKDIAEEMKEPFKCKGGGKAEAVQGRVIGEKDRFKEFFEKKGFVVLEC